MNRNNKCEYDYLIKLILIGDSGVGKTNILQKFSENKFDIGAVATIGFEICTKSITIDDKIIKFQIWDTAGQERYNSLTRSYLRLAMGVLLVYDITNRKSFLNCEKWINEVRDNNINIPILLIGNKIDLKLQRMVSYKEGMDFSKKHNIKFLESTSTDERKGLTPLDKNDSSLLDKNDSLLLTEFNNINQIFINIAKDICENKNNSPGTNYYKHVPIILNDVNSLEKSNSKCC